MTEVLLLSRRQLLNVAIWTTIATSYYLYVTQEEIIAVVGGFTLHITDLLFGLISVYCFVGGRSRWRTSAEMILLLLCMVLFLSFLRGEFDASGTNAGVEFRVVTVFIALVFFVYFWGPDLDINWIFNKIVLLGWGIVVLAVARDILGFHAFILEFLPPDYEFRSLNAPAALMLGQATLIATNKAMFELQSIKRWSAGLTAFVFLTILYFSHQRTATFATIMGLGIIAAFAQPRYRLIIALGAFCVLAAGLILLAAAWIEAGSNGLADYLPDSIAMVIFGEKTFGARELAWNAYLYNFSTWSIFEQLTGRPFGVPILAVLTETLTEVSISPHNGYLIYMLRIGLLGASVFVISLIYALGKGLFLLATASRGNQQLCLAVAIVASHAIYSISYLLPNEQGLLLALAIQIISRGSQSIGGTNQYVRKQLNRRLGTELVASR